MDRSRSRSAPAAPFATVVRLPEQWFILCRSSELGRRPLARVLQGTPLALFRDGEGKARALLDRCPHRNVPLSNGKVAEGGWLECGYHGWCFDGAGACRKVPGLQGEPEASTRRVPAYATREQDGFVWVYSTADAAPAREPFRFPHLATPGYSSVFRRYRVAASVHALVENALDVPHTAYLHGGLFRTSKKSNPIEVVVRTRPDSVEAEYLGEPAPRGLIGKVLAPGGGVVTHFDRFLMPSVAQVEYRLGETSHLYSTAAHTPVGDFDTEVWAVVTFRLPVPGWLVKPFVTPVVERIFAQDARMLAQQTRTLQAFGAEQYANTELDAIGPGALRLMRKAAQGGAPEVDAEAAEKVEERRFTMRA
jgi:phenylpropionate dioxygenase-like ring-hydroxylating dioxygenase large terminal subunit